MSFNYRCTTGKCRKYVTFKHPITWYIKLKTCVCGGKLSNVTQYEKARNKARVCNCDGWFFPHHKGTSVWCLYHPTGPTDLDYKQRYG